MIPGRYHPESPARLRAVLDALDGPDFARLDRREAPEAALDDIARVHPRRFVERLLDAVPRSGHVGIDADTIMSPGSGEAALRAAGAVVAAVDAVVAGEADNAFCAVRPPGHHAEPGRAMGFCLFNNAAIGALAGARGARPRAGRGDRFRRASRQRHAGLLLGRCRACSTPRRTSRRSIPAPAARGETGRRQHRQRAAARRCPARASSAPASTRDILPALDAFRPELLLISAGFDAHRSDPLAQLMLDEADYAWVTEQLLEIARRHAGGRVVSTLEGGYDLAGARRQRGGACPRADGGVS